MSDKDLNNDYEKIRKSLYDLTDQGDEAIELMMELARESEHPRAFEVLGQLIKQNAEISEKILKMHKTKKEVEKIDDTPLAIESAGGVTNNNVFIGSTADLQKLLRDEKVIDETS
jgi:DNA-binding PadR family transcriptional regulator